MKCERCGNPSTVHVTAIKDRKKSEQHLCVECAQSDNSLTSHANINELLAKFVAKHRPGQPDKP